MVKHDQKNGHDNKSNSNHNWKQPKNKRFFINAGEVL